AAGAPLACGVFRQRDVRVPSPVVWTALACVVVFAARGVPADARRLAAGAALDPDFGLLMAAGSPPLVGCELDFLGKLVSCVPGWYCNAALYLGAHTLYDGRTEPFSAQRVRDLSESLSDPGILRRWPVDYAIVPPDRAAPLNGDPEWREVA